MFLNNKPLRRNWSVKLWIIALVIASTTTVYAAFFTINTNDGADQAGLPAAFQSDAIGDGAANYDIAQFWAVSDATPPTEFYFRAELDGYLPIESYLEARLDCNNNGNFTDAADVLVEYLPQSAGESDAVYSITGNWGSFDTYLVTYGEPTSTTGAYEWRAPTSGGTVDWSACLTGQINIQLATVNGNTFADEDVTVTRGFDVPTAVTLQQVSASSGGLALILLIGMGMTVGTAVLLHQRKQE